MLSGHHNAAPLTLNQLAARSGLSVDEVRVQLIIHFGGYDGYVRACTRPGLKSHFSEDPRRPLRPNPHPATPASQRRYDGDYSSAFSDAVRAIEEFQEDLD